MVRRGAGDMSIVTVLPSRGAAYRQLNEISFNEFVSGICMGCNGTPRPAPPRRSRAERLLPPRKL